MVLEGEVRAQAVRVQAPKAVVVEEERRPVVRVQAPKAVVVEAGRDGQRGGFQASKDVITQRGEVVGREQGFKPRKLSSWIVQAMGLLSMPKCSRKIQPGLLVFHQLCRRGTQRMGFPSRSRSCQGGV